MLWDSGHGQLGRCRTGRTATRSTPAWARGHRGYDEIIAGDWDGDGRVDDMIIWDRDTGNYVVQSWSNYDTTYRGRGHVVDGLRQARSPATSTATAASTTLFIWDQTTGTGSSSSLVSFRLDVSRSAGPGRACYDELIVGDWSAGGDMDEMILWDRNTGLWVLQSWSNFRHTLPSRSGYWSTAIDIAAPGDYDTDGRVDDLFLYDASTGQLDALVVPPQRPVDPPVAEPGSTATT